MQDFEQECRFELATALQAYVGHGKASAHELGPKTGIPWRRIYKLMNGEAKPHWWEVRNLIRELGAGFQNHLTEPVGIGGARELSLDYCHFNFRQTSSRYNYEFDVRMEDGVLCHGDQMVLEQFARDVAMVAPLIGEPTVRRVSA